MRIEFDSAKREQTFAARGRDMARAAASAGATLTVEDDRRDYGEARFITIGFLHEVWWTSYGRLATMVAGSSA